VKILSQGDYPVSFGTGGKNSLPFISVWAIIDGMHNSLGSFVNRKYVIACVTIQSCDAAWETRALCVNLPREIRTPFGYAEPSSSERTAGAIYRAPYEFTLGTRIMQRCFFIDGRNPSWHP